MDEEIELLERLLRKPKSKGEESTSREKTCSHVPSSEEEMILATEEAKVKFNFQIKLENVGTKGDEHENVIREIKYELFLEDNLQEQHSELINFEDEMRFMEEWLAKGTNDEDYKEFADPIYSEEKIGIPYSRGMNAKERNNLEYIKENNIQ
jgi:hypothetical protein